MVWRGGRANGGGGRLPKKARRQKTVAGDAGSALDARMQPHKRIIVTGGSGKAGHWIVKHLVEQGYEVINVDSRRPATDLCRTIVADLTQLGQVVTAFSPFGTGSRAPYVGVIHMAAIPRAHDMPNDEIFRVNTLSTYNVLEACALLNIERAVVASSESSYGICFASEFFEPRYLPVDEAHPQLPEDTYGLSKVVNEVTAEAFHRRTGMQVISLRLGNILCPEFQPSGIPAAHSLVLHRRARCGHRLPARDREGRSRVRSGHSCRG
jgi:nucleoside-diphosphate-sugar epimerase